MAQLKEQKWELMEVGEEFGPVEVVVDDQKIKSFAYAVDDYDPAFFVGKPKGQRIGHPVVLCNDLLRAPHSKYDPHTGSGTSLHAKQEFEVFKPVRLGQKVIVTGRFVDKYIRREKPYIVFEAEARDEDGELVLRGRSTQMRGLKPGVVKAGGSPVPSERPAAPTPIDASGPVVETASKDIVIGARVKPLVKRVTQEQMTVFTGTGRKSIHIDLDVALKSGLPNTVAQGMMSAAYVAETLTKFFGNGWRRGGQLSVSFISPVYPGDTITTNGVVREIVPEGHSQRVVLDVWCENQAGKKVTVGTGSGLVR